MLEYYDRFFFDSFLKSSIKYQSVFLVILCHAVQCFCRYLHFTLLLAVPFMFAGQPLRIVCGNQAGYCLDTPLSEAVSASNTAMDEAEISACPPLSPAMEAINMEVSITEHYALCLRITS
jgi:hypothetical protein